MVGLCYPHTLELTCHSLFPKCDPLLKQVIPPCREMCFDFQNACPKLTVPKNNLSKKSLDFPSGDTSLVVDITSVEYNYGYLPSLGGDTPCLFKAVTCGSPPSVQNAATMNISMNYKNYSVLDTMSYSCREGFQMEGNKKISCMYSWEWSTPPKCTLNTSSTTHTLVVVLPVLMIPLAIRVGIIVVIYRTKSKAVLKRSNEPLFSRNREFDAFIIYHFDSDDGFVVNDLVPALEAIRGLKLFIHSRDFIPGRNIKDNTEEAIDSSNSAIIIMSQGFVDSFWCKEEFTHCYIDNIIDAAFRLFVIMMQPADTLVNISNYMNSYFNTKTYLKVNDPEVSTKLAAHLDNGRHPENVDAEMTKMDNFYYKDW